MAKIKIRFKDWTNTGKTGGVGIYGLPTNEGESGEYQIGDELEVDEVPVGWLSRVEILTAPKSKETEFVTGDDAPRRGRPRSDG